MLRLRQFAHSWRTACLTAISAMSFLVSTPPISFRGMASMSSSARAARRCCSSKKLGSLGVVVPELCFGVAGGVWSKLPLFDVTGVCEGVNEDWTPSERGPLF